MNKLIRLEEAGLFAISLLVYARLDMGWGWYFALILLPDIGMLGYLHNVKTGAYSYNLFHHKLIALSVGALGYYINNQWLLVAGVILFSHSSLDRMLGYGLKYEKGFKSTHLGDLS